MVFKSNISKWKLGSEDLINNRSALAWHRNNNDSQDIWRIVSVLSKNVSTSYIMHLGSFHFRHWKSISGKGVKLRTWSTQLCGGHGSNSSHHVHKRYILCVTVFIKERRRFWKWLFIKKRCDGIGYGVNKIEYVNCGMTYWGLLIHIALNVGHNGSVNGLSPF